MIDRIFAAPRQLDDEDWGVAFAIEYGMGYEIPVFESPEMLIHKEQHLDILQLRYQNIPGWRSLHVPLQDINPVSVDPEIALASLRRCTQAVEACKALGAKYIIFQSPYNPAYKYGGKYQEWVSASADFWKSLIEEQLRATDIVLLIANFMEEEPTLLRDLISRVDSTRLKICLDTGHVNLFSAKPAIDWLDFLDTDVEYVRASNNDQATNSHSAFDEGTIDMKGLINHMALLPQRLHLAICVQGMEGVRSSYAMLQPYLQMQQGLTNTKSLII